MRPAADIMRPFLPVTERRFEWRCDCMRACLLYTSYQEEGKAAISLEPGMVITIPANVKHWHGAKKDAWFSHIAIEVPGEETSNEWCEPVSDEAYDQL